MEKLDPGCGPGMYCREHRGSDDEKGAGGIEGPEHPRCAPGGVPRSRETISPLVGGSQRFPSLRATMGDLHVSAYLLGYCTLE